MSFRKRNVVIGTPAGSSVQRHPKQTAIGTRPSPFDGRPTTSTGTASLDQLLAGHSGLPLGHSILIEESSTTDFGGILLRYYAAEGLVQGHQVHVLGVDDSWRRELPGLDLNRSKAEEKKGSAANEEKMKIAWRYETLGNRPTPARGEQCVTRKTFRQTTDRDQSRPRQGVLPLGRAYSATRSTLPKDSRTARSKGKCLPSLPGYSELKFQECPHLL